MARRYVSTRASALRKQELLDYSKGYNTYLANDVVRTYSEVL
jgi:hypothetical protein